MAIVTHKELYIQWLCVDFDLSVNASWFIVDPRTILIRVYQLHFAINRATHQYEWVLRFKTRMFFYARYPRILIGNITLITTESTCTIINNSANFMIELWRVTVNVAGLI